MTMTALEILPQPTASERDRTPARRPLGWRVALWSVVSVRWAAVALVLFLAG